MGLADRVLVMEVYGSNEEPIPGATGALVADAVPLSSDQVTFEPSFSAVPRWLVEEARPGDLILTLGDGIVTTLGPEILDLLAIEGHRMTASQVARRHRWVAASALGVGCCRRRHPCAHRRCLEVHAVLCRERGDGDWQLSR